MTRPRQHWRQVKTRQGVVPRIINRGLTWVKRHFRNETVGDTTPEQAHELLMQGTRYGRKEPLREGERIVKLNGKDYVLRLK